MSDELSDDEKAQLRNAKVWSANDYAPLENAAVKLFRLYAIIGRMAAEIQTRSTHDKLVAMRFLSPLIYPDEYYDLPYLLWTPEANDQQNADDRAEDRPAPGA